MEFRIFVKVGVSIMLLLLTIFIVSCAKKPFSVLQKRSMLIQQAMEKERALVPLKSNAFGIVPEKQLEVMSSALLNDYFFEKKSGEPLLNELMTISKVRPSDITAAIENCRERNCTRWELYNYALNGTAVIIIDEETDVVIDHNFYPSMQGEISEELGRLAVKIAATDKRVIEAYGEMPDTTLVRMQATKTALNRTTCQRSNHLCVAPTFVKENRALWVIVDLTDLKVVGIKWTEVGLTGMPVTERSAQNDEIMECCCDVSTNVAKMGWDLNYSLTRSDGLKIGEIKYNNEPIVQSIKTVDWHVSYSQSEGFGYSDAMGCPEYSQAAVVAKSAAKISEIIEGKDTIGFSIVQDYFSVGWPTPCSYNYRQEFIFYKDGSFRPVVGSLGRGCGNDGTYRPVTRISFYGSDQSFSTQTNGELKKWTEEGWIHENEIFEYHNGNCIGVLETGNNKRFNIEANLGQFGDSSRGDNAHIYVTANKVDGSEGEGDLPTIGPCCNVGFEQGPEKYINGELLANRSLVFWYVPLLKNDDRVNNEYCWAESILVNGKYEAKVYPCFSGPKFTLVD